MRYSLESRQKISNTLKGHLVSSETREKIRKSMEKHREKLSLIHKGDLNPMKNKEVSNKVRQALLGRVPKTAFKNGDIRISGVNNHRWRGGITSVNEKIRKSQEYKIWRTTVFERDNYMCVFGGKEHGTKLEADHIKPFSLFPESRFDLDNGRTLCKDCHIQTDTYAGKLRNYA